MKKIILSAFFCMALFATTTVSAQDAKCAKKECVCTTCKCGDKCSDKKACCSSEKKAGCCDKKKDCKKTETKASCSKDKKSETK